MTDVRLRRVARLKIRKGVVGERPVLNLENVIGGAGVTQGELVPAEAGDLLAFEPGDVLFSKLRPYLRKSLHVTEPLYGTGEFLSLVPGPDLDGRFLFYVTLSDTWAGWAEQRSYGSKMPRTSWDDMAEYRLHLPALDEQRRIANFLDEQTSILDRAKVLRQRQTKLLDERRGATFIEALIRIAGIAVDSLDPASRQDDWRPLGRVLTQLTNGFVGPTRDLLVEDGVRYLQSLHIKQGDIDFQRRPYFVPAEWVAARPRITLRRDDLLIVQTGALGEVALVNDEYAGASCHALLIARAGAAVRPDYLWQLFRSDWGKHALLRRKTGALHPHLEAGEIRDILIPVPSLEQQAAIVSEVGVQESQHTRVLSLMSRANDLLEERKRALITATTSGHFDVTTARSVA